MEIPCVYVSASTGCKSNKVGSQLFYGNEGCEYTARGYDCNEAARIFQKGYNGFCLHAAYKKHGRNHHIISEKGNEVYRATLQVANERNPHPISISNVISGVTPAGRHGSSCHLKFKE